MAASRRLLTPEGSAALLAATVASRATVGSGSALNAGGTPNIDLAPVRAPPILRPTLARRRHRHRVLRGGQQVALLARDAAGRLEHFEQPVVNGFGPGISCARGDAFPEVSGGCLDVGPLPVHRLKM